VVLFAHGSGSSRHSPRNTFVARRLQEAGLGTLLMDLLTPREDAVYANRFDIPLLARRLSAARAALGQHEATARLAVGCFGASTGSAAALLLASDPTQGIGAVVSRGGRPDLVLDVLGRVTAPTLLIVGGADVEVLELNRKAYQVLAGPKRLEVIPGAGHLFEEPGALEEVARLAAEWFRSHLG
jgi:putative phosphoribosyl transferase